MADADASEGFDPRLQSVFEQEILHQWSFAEFAINLMNERVDGPSDNVFWFAQHAAFSALANISKIFWPSNGAKPETVRRCDLMRAEYDVSDNALLGKRHVRNAFEHFDERLDTWVASSQRHNLADRIIAPREGAIVGLDPSDYMRWFDPQTKTVYVFGDSIELQALVTETEALVGRVQAKQTERELLRWTQATW